MELPLLPPEVIEYLTFKNVFMVLGIWVAISVVFGGLWILLHYLFGDRRENRP